MAADILNPVVVEQHIRHVTDRIAKSAAVCDERYRAVLDTDRAYDLEYARSYLAHQGPQTEKRYAAEVATADERAARDVADAAYRYADRLAKALQAELMAYQSLNKSVLATYSAAGVGER